MKFTKEEAYKDLVAKMTTNGEKLNLSERSINEQLENLISLVATEETELSDFVEKVMPLIKTADNNVRNDVSVGINKYKEENSIKGATDTTKKDDKVVPKNEENDLEKRLIALEKELQDAKHEQYTQSIRKKVIDKLKTKGVTNTEWISNLLSEVVIAEDFDVDGKVDAYLKLYNMSNSNFNPDATPQVANANGKPDLISETIKQAMSLAKSQNLINN